jgi:hypothetical protein
VSVGKVEEGEEEEEERGSSAYASVVEDAVVVGGLYFAAALAAVCHKILIVHEPLTNQQMQKRNGVKMNEDKLNLDVESLSTKAVRK